MTKESLIGGMRLSQSKVISSSDKDPKLIKLGVLCQTKMAFELDGLTEGDLAHHLGWSVSKLDKFLWGKYNPTFTELVLIFGVFNFDPSELAEVFYD